MSDSPIKKYLRTYLTSQVKWKEAWSKAFFKYITLKFYFCVSNPKTSLKRKKYKENKPFNIAVKREARYRKNDVLFKQEFPGKINWGSVWKFKKKNNKKKRQQNHETD